MSDVAPFSRPAQLKPNRPRNRGRIRSGNRSGIPFTREERIAKQKLFLQTFRKTGIISDGLRAALVTRTTVENWRRKYPKFEEHYQRCYADSGDVIRREIHRRGVEGYMEGVWYRGELVGHETRYSDQLLRLLAHSRFPEFRQRQEVTGEDGGPVVFKVVFEDERSGEIVDGEYRRLT